MSQNNYGLGNARSLDPKLITNRQVVFVCGLHKSGTTLLSQLICAHPKVSGFSNTGVLRDEGQFLQSVYPTGQAHGGPGLFGFDPTSRLNEKSTLATDANAQTLYDQWSKFWNLNASLLLEKSPPNLVRTRFLQCLFPSSYFIVLRRHPIAVSYATQKWSNTSILSLISHWVTCYEVYREDKPHLTQALEITYEQLVREPSETIACVFRFLGLEEMPINNRPKTTVNSKYFSRWASDRADSIRSRELELATHLFEQRLNAFSYSCE